MDLQRSAGRAPALNGLFVLGCSSCELSSANCASPAHLGAENPQSFLWLCPREPAGILPLALAFSDGGIFGWSVFVVPCAPLILQDVYSLETGCQ